MRENEDKGNTKMKLEEAREFH